MNIKESIQQINELIEAWELNEACLNQTDIDAIKCLLKQNQELKKQLKDKTEDYKRMKDNFDSKVDVLTEIDTQQKEFIKLLEGNMRFAPEPRKGLLKDILNKYKEIIGVSDENN